MPNFQCINCGFGSLVRSNFKLDTRRRAYCLKCWSTPSDDWNSIIQLLPPTPYVDPRQRGADPEPVTNRTSSILFTTKRITR